jgi:hypothetical protein
MANLAATSSPNLSTVTSHKSRSAPVRGVTAVDLGHRRAGLAARPVISLLGQSMYKDGMVNRAAQHWHHLVRGFLLSLR